MESWRRSLRPFMALGIPPTLWLLLFFLIPIGIVWAFSFGDKIGIVDIDINGRILVLGTRHQPSGNRAALRRLVGGLPFSDGFETGLIEAWSGNVGAE